MMICYKEIDFPNPILSDERFLQPLVIKDGEVSSYEKTYHPQIDKSKFFYGLALSNEFNNGPFEPGIPKHLSDEHYGVGSDGNKYLLGARRIF